MCSTCECDKPSSGDDQGLSPGAEYMRNVARCRKCGADPFIIIDKIHVECKDCFKESCNKKLRSTIGKTKLLKNNDPILVAHSGGPSSAALLALLKNSIDFETRRQQKFRPSILHVDTQVCPSRGQGIPTFDERRHRLESFLSETQSNYPDWPIYWTTLDLAFMDKKEYPFLKFNPKIGLTDVECHELFFHAKANEMISARLLDMDLTDQHQCTRNLLKNLILKVADSINSSISDQNDLFKYIFSGSSSTQLANDMLVDVILGKGATISPTVAVCDNRSVIPVMRPMRDFSKKEIAYYLRCIGIQARIEPNLLTFAEGRASIQTATESFLSKLFVDYPSTYNTLLNTASKMKNQEELTSLLES